MHVKTVEIEGLPLLSSETLEHINQVTECLLIYLERYEELTADVRNNSAHMIMGIAGQLTRQVFLKMPGDIITDAFSASVALQNFLKGRTPNERSRSVKHLKAIRRRLGLDQIFGKIRQASKSSEEETDC